MNVTVIGSGVYGNAIARILVESKNAVKMWTEQEDVTNVPHPEGSLITNNFEEAIKDASICFILTGSKFVKSVLEGLKPFIGIDVLLVLGSKGILDDGILMSDIAKEVLPNNPISVISGPTFAKDIANLDPVGFTIATDELVNFERIKDVLKNVFLEYSNAIEATELASTLKNAYAIGSGILEGLRFHNSTKCLYITKTLYEMIDIFKSLNLEGSSALSLAGVGDLVLTCSSTDSRNYTFGTILAKNQPDANEYLSKTTVEGYDNLITFINLFSKRNVSAPIIECLNGIIIKGENPNDLVKLLLDSK